MMVEATRAILFNEINSLFESVDVTYRHLCLLCNVMTRFGRLMSIDRYGINKNDIDTLAKVDPVTGESANIMMGQAIRGGTAFLQSLLDDQMLVKLMESKKVYFAIQTRASTCGGTRATTYASSVFS
jgi:hypothetical protein